MSRSQSINQKVDTPFGPHYVHIEYTDDGTFSGGWISHPRKDADDPDGNVSQVTILVNALADGLNEALAAVAKKHEKSDGG